jgi:hypothetical protein
MPKEWAYWWLVLTFNIERDLPARRAWDPIRGGADVEAGHGAIDVGQEQSVASDVI